MSPVLLSCALILDALLGEPRWLWSHLPHPVVGMGHLIGALDRWLNKGGYRRARGVAALVILLTAVGLLSLIPALLPFGWVLEIALGAILLAHRSLIDHVREVAAGLRQGLQPGRAAVRMIVGRDPDQLDRAGVARAAIESAAENFSDGVAAPAFWFAVAGLPGIALYKAINTADSMIGYRTAQYRYFGWASARLDDLVNLIPARLSGALICAVGGGWQAARVTLRDAGLHRSPNAGWPEAALAASLGITLAGPRAYTGEGVTHYPYLYPEGRHHLGPGDIDAACRLLWRAWAGILGIAVVAALARALV